MVALLSLVALACSSPPAPEEKPPPVEEQEQPEDCRIPARVRRLTRAELDAAASALMGPTTLFSDSLAAEDRPNGFDNHEGLLVSSLIADQLAVVGGRLAERVAADPRWRCTNDEAACFQGFLDGFVGRAFRRPLTADEQQGLRTVFEAGRNEADYSTGVRLVAETVVQSPSFLYRTELGADGSTGPRPLEPYELASALSFLVTGGAPDDELLRAATDGELSSPDERERQTRRLLATPEGRRHLTTFVRQWFGLSDLGSLQKDTAAFPDFSSEWRSSMRAETETFLTHLFEEGDGTLSTLLGADYTFADDRMAEFYGVPERPGAEPGRITLPPKRRGLLTQASVLASYAHFGETSPVRRVLLVYTRLLCGVMPPPPPTVNTSLPVPDGERTVRERLVAHTTNPSCAGCHARFDPIGLGFEDFDGMGRQREIELGRPVDDSGRLMSPSMGDGPAFAGGAEAAALLATNPEAEACMRAQLFRFGFGRRESAELCEANDVADALAQSGGDFREALVALARSSTLFERKEQHP